MTTTWRKHRVSVRPLRSFTFVKLLILLTDTRCLRQVVVMEEVAICFSRQLQDWLRRKQRTLTRSAVPTGMPPVEVYRGSDGKLMIYHGVARATRVAKLLPATLVRVEVIDDLTTPVGQFPTVEDLLP